MSCVIKPIPITRVKVDKSVMTYLMDFGKAIELGTFAWAIECSGSKVLVDTGCPADIQSGLGFPATQIHTLQDGLSRIGWDVKDIDIVILTHLHLDHIAYSSELRNSTFVIQDDELKAALNPHPAYKGFYPTKVIKELLKDLRIERVKGDKEIVKGISVMMTPGHSPGGQTVIVETHKGIIALTGFCCIKENFEPIVKGISESFIVPGIHIDIVKLYESMSKIKEVADVIIPIHDSSYFNIKQIP